MTDDDYRTHTVPTDLDREVRGWLGDHDPLSRNALHALRTDLGGLGEPTRVDGEAVTWLRAADAATFGIFAHERDLVLYELDDDVAHGALLGYPVGDARWAPVLLCIAGPSADAARAVPDVADAIERAIDGELVGP